MADTIIDLVTADELSGELADVYEAIAAATPADYDTVKSQVQQNAQDIAGIEGKIPAQASAQNQLADKAFVNSSIQTNTATFRGTYNLVTDLGLTVSATEEQTATAIATHLASLVPPVVPENNDYVFVQIPRETSDPTVVVRYDRYKCTVTEAGGVVTRTWSFEFSLNNSSFTADQWAAINSGATANLIQQISANQLSIGLLNARDYIVVNTSTMEVTAVDADGNASLTRTLFNASGKSSYSSATAYSILFNPRTFIATKLATIGDPLIVDSSAITKFTLTSLKLNLQIGSANSPVKARIEVRDNGTNVANSNWTDSVTVGSFADYTFEFVNFGSLDANKEYEFFFKGQDSGGNTTNIAVIVGGYGNVDYTVPPWKIRKTSDNSIGEITSNALDTTMTASFTGKVSVALANKADIGIKAFSPLATYVEGERVIYANDLYECLAGGHAAGVWNASHFKKIFSVGSNVTLGNTVIKKRATSQSWEEPNGNIVGGQNNITVSGKNNIAFGYGGEVYNCNPSSTTDTTMDNILFGTGSHIMNDLLANARKPTTDTTAVSDAVYFGYGAKYSSATDYQIGDYCSYGNGIYQCTASTNGNFDSSKWSLKDALDYDSSKTYAIGDVCEHSGSLYTCSTAIDTPKDWDVDDWTYASLGEFQEGAMVSLTTSAGSTLPQDDYLQIYIAPAGYLSGISQAILLGAYSVIRASGGIGIGNNITVNDPDATVIGNGATSHGAKSLNFAATELIKVFLGDANLVDLINQAVADQMIKAAVSAEVTQTRSTPTATRKLLALNPANPTGEKTEVTAQDIGAATPSDIPEVIDPANATAAGSAADALAVKTALAGKLSNSGYQTLNGTLTVQNANLPDGEERLRAGDFGFDYGAQIHVHYGNLEYLIGVRDISGILALLSDIYAAVQQIAPAWVSGTTYDATAKVSYNGVVYARKTSGTITSSTNPATDTVNWEAKKVSELFLPLTGGTISGGLKCNNIGMQSGPLWFGDSATNADLAFVVSGNQRTPAILANGAFIYFPYAFGTLALLQNLAANHSTSATYALNQLCVYSNKLYRCTTAIETAEAWTAAHWTEATVEDVLAAIRSALALKEDASNKVTSLSAQSTDTQYPSAKCVYDNLVPKASSTAIAPNWSNAAVAYAVNQCITYNGNAYECMVAYTTDAQSPTPDNDIYDDTVTPATGHWKLTDMTSPDATLDITSAESLRVVSANGQILWQQGYDLKTTSSATLANEAVNKYDFAANATANVSLTLPTPPTGKVGDFILDVTNPALDTANFTQSAFSDASTYAVGAEVIYDSKIWRCVTAVSTAGAWTGATNWEEAHPYFSIAGLSSTVEMVVPSGENLSDILTFAPGAKCELYFTLTSFAVNSRPTWKVVRQDVEVVA